MSQITIVNQSNDPYESKIIIFQKGAPENALPWCVMLASAPGERHPLIVPDSKLSLWIGVLPDKTELMSKAVIAHGETEIPLAGILSADIVMTGGGAKPYQFTLDSIKYATPPEAPHENVCGAPWTRTVTSPRQIMQDEFSRLMCGPNFDFWSSSKALWRERNQRDVAERAGRILSQKKISRVFDATNPADLEDILEACKDAVQNEFKDFYARMLAGALNPETAELYRREFLDIAKRLGLVEAMVLMQLNLPDEDVGPISRKEITNRIGHRHTMACVLANMARLGLIHPVHEGTEDGPTLTPLGRQLVMLLR